MTSDAITTGPAAAGSALLEGRNELWRALPALQQPEWEDLDLLADVTFDLADRPALVTAGEVAELRGLLAEVVAGRFHVVQAGDCAEDPAECEPEHVNRKVALLEALAGVMSMNTLLPTLRIGRMAGQFAKPRSRPTESVDGVELPVYRGHMVNGPEPDARLRRPDPRRLRSGYEAASRAMEALRGRIAAQPPAFGTPVWTSHEALLLDYEAPLIRLDETGRRYLASTHWPWIGYRTNQLDGAHVALLASVANPVASKVGPGMSTGELLALCERLDPDREPGRLTLIARMGADAIAERLPAMAAAVHDAGHPVIWLSDPMHGNTVAGPGGLKTRLVDTVVREVKEFQNAIGGVGAVVGGLHLETTPDDVTECASDERSMESVGDRYTSLCDPRLNPAQALEVAAAWQGRSLLR
ncbi:phospho-2-dehydro-3-deoxyheptonate aldolase [Streptomyces ipomoeae]|uniref:Phospho-2-dehydro-3-deoxyheptonate aldolase n=2 Tax=Streptomyces ipomoeae TaxID=103232 RepID=L1KV84_9ACTN|nr:3-deoxy-7-phosphoheptulonate synthase [Streptomyces ipomoeae]EKX64370.1 class-II DAHP synthetase family protein [Streptomyces ipomoeae 91-03]MDX2693009.1 3-deoxy-7-phosphoheptulonate synthase [Streptomyces ipomoeae]MDX2820793.1 3-deoxy-7-phosphoheptulonate synthase [Streptomyces ipomoeae]MDX2838515.1 3-deoxy-7-phosphoheptulonate synthase [Streptomyces ipomoeae]MDX2872571.1 3-deoxy-7-phosphoheptulonate synthase [Streptomyces ipomoeae]